MARRGKLKVDEQIALAVAEFKHLFAQRQVGVEIGFVARASAYRASLHSFLITPNLSVPAIPPSLML